MPFQHAHHPTITATFLRGFRPKLRGQATYTSRPKNCYSACKFCKPIDRRTPKKTADSTQNYKKVRKHSKSVPGTFRPRCICQFVEGADVSVLVKVAA